MAAGTRTGRDVEPKADPCFDLIEGVRSMRLLIAEDDTKLAGTLARGLRADGYAVDVATSGEGALFNARVYDYDAVILDVMLPGIDGVEVCTALRDEKRWTPVIMLTARDGVADRIRGLDGGADDYLVKPFDYGELVARLRALIRRGAQERPQRVTIADLEVDPAAHTVTRQGQAIALTAREFALLEYLARNAGCVVTRSELLDHVWDANYDGSGNVVDVYIGYLRRKLDDPFDVPLIRTVRGAGFVIGAP
jgi:two-component system OmpR family response regulator